MVQLSVQASLLIGMGRLIPCLECWLSCSVVVLYVCWTVLHKSWRVAQVLRFGQSVGGLVEHKEFVLSSRFANSKLLLLFLLPPQNTKHNSRRDAEQRGEPNEPRCRSPWLGCKINCPQFSPTSCRVVNLFLSEFKNEVMRNGSLHPAIYICKGAHRD